MITMQRISRLRQPRSSRASIALLVITLSVFTAIAHLAVEQRGSTEVTRESRPLVHGSEDLDLYSLLHHLRF